MRSIPQAVQDAIERDGFLHFGLANRVLNLSKTARFIKPLIESRTKKSVSVSAVVMALSRLRIQKHRANVQLKAITLDALSVTKDLVEITYERTRQTVAEVGQATRALQESAYVVTTFGTTEITVIIDAALEKQLCTKIPNKPKVVVRNLVAIRAQFSPKYIELTGMVYTLIQQLTFQNVNVIEFSSTYTELTFYLHAKDMKVAFDTLYDQFM